MPTQADTSRMAKALLTPDERELVDRAAFLPIGQYEDGSLTFALPGFIKDAWDGAQRTYLDAGHVPVPDAPPGTKWAGNTDALNVASVPALGTFGLRASGLTKDVGDLGMFAGRGARTADHAKLAQAEKMAAEGAPREQIWNDTGWFQGVDGKWRFEIDDSGSRIGTKAMEELTKGGDHGATQRTLAGTLHHRPLYEAYPDVHLADVDVRYNSGLTKPDGLYERSHRWTERPRITINTNSLDGDFGPRSVLLHEVQHDIQGRDGFGIGANNLQKLDNKMLTRLVDEKMQTMGPIAEAQGLPLDVMRKVVRKELSGQMGRDMAYTRSSGEVEARTTQKRMNLTPEERAARAPWLDYDVPESDQIVKFYANDAGAALPGLMSFGSEPGGKKR